MTKQLHICVVSSSRADYGLLLSPMRAIQADPTFRLSVILTGQHLMKDTGDTAVGARADGFDIATEIEMGLVSDDAPGVTHACGQVMHGMADALARLRPDLLLVLGDRYEILCCAMAATLARIPIAHIAGGDITEGAFDEGFRHAITKLSHIHFVTNPIAAQRVSQLGEANVHVTGSPGLDLVSEIQPLPRSEFFQAVGLEPAGTNILATFHPVTLAQDSMAQFEELLGALGDQADTAIIVTGSNVDPEGRHIDVRAKAFVQSRTNCVFVSSLGMTRYFSALSHMDIVVGNSSSGLYEAPSFGIPTVNVGYRQEGRLKADSVFDAHPLRDSIAHAIQFALARGRKTTVNPYGDGYASKRILAVLKEIEDPSALLRKTFRKVP